VGATTCINALSRTFSQFFATRLATGVDDAAPPGIYSLVADYFEPGSRARAMGVVSAAAPLGAILGSAIALTLVSAGAEWRSAFYITGTVGLLVGAITYLVVRDVPRGSSEPELEGLLAVDVYRASLGELPRLLRNRSLALLYLQGFFGVFPWNALTYWVVTYLEVEMGVSPGDVMLVMALMLPAMVVGNVVAGFIGDYLYRVSRRGRAAFGAAVVYGSALLIYLTMTARSFQEFLVYAVLTAFEIPMAGPNVSAMIADVTEPELRSSATGFLRFFENLGSAVAPAVVGYMAEAHGLGISIMAVSISTWLLCGAFFTALAAVIPRDMERLRRLMAERAGRLGRELRSRGWLREEAPMAGEHRRSR